MNVGKSGQGAAGGERQSGRRRVIARLCAAALGALGLAAVAQQQARTTLVVAAYPAVDEIVRKALPAWQQRQS